MLRKPPKLTHKEVPRSCTQMLRKAAQADPQRSTRSCPKPYYKEEPQTDQSRTTKLHTKATSSCTERAAATTKLYTKPTSTCREGCPWAQRRCTSCTAKAYQNCCQKPSKLTHKGAPRSYAKPTSNRTESLPKAILQSRSTKLQSTPRPLELHHKAAPQSRTARLYPTLPTSRHKVVPELLREAAQAASGRVTTKLYTKPASTCRESCPRPQRRCKSCAAKSYRKGVPELLREAVKGVPELLRRTTKEYQNCCVKPSKKV